MCHRFGAIALEQFSVHIKISWDPTIRVANITEPPLTCPVTFGPVLPDDGLDAFDHFMALEDSNQPDSLTDSPDNG